MGRRLLGVGLTMALVAPVAAQERVAVDSEQRSQIQFFEAVLQRAVLQGGEKLAREAMSIMPFQVVATTGDARARGLPLPGGVFFDVTVPNLLQTFTNLVQQYARPERPVTNRVVDPKVTAQGLPAPDPMGAPPAKPPAILSNPDQVYTDLVREALIEAMLENSRPLSIKEDEFLAVAAAGPSGMLSSALNMQGATLILSIKGVDLAAYHQGKITKEEARKRVVAKPF